MIFLLLDRNKKIDVILYTVPKGTSSGSDNFQNNQNSDSQNSRSDKNPSKSQILSSENASSAYFGNYES
jgi:hypothetical protein